LVNAEQSGDLIAMRHHFVPQFWMRRFADNANQIHCREGAVVRIVSTKNVMQLDDLYALFNDHWQMSYALETALAGLERDASLLFDKLDNPAEFLSDDDADHLMHFMALQACRHPDVFGLAHRRARELAEFLSDAHSYLQAGFALAAARFGIDSADAREIHTQLVTRPPDVLLREFDEVLRTSPQDQKLPATDAIRALPVIQALISPLKLNIVHAPTGTDFVLGDTPLPQFELARGFSVPLSKSTAAIAANSHAPKPRIARRSATVAEVNAINREQWNNALKIVIGSSVHTLNAM
jgi:hypothetical protein